MEFSDTNESDQRSRGFDHYATVFGYDSEGANLKGKRILDVGAANSNFAEEAGKRGATVVRLDPKYSNEAPTTGVDKAVAAAAQSLPFLEAIFDEVVGSYSFWWIDKKMGLEKSLAELWRVTRDGGHIKLEPAYMAHLPFILRDKHLNQKLPLNANLIQVEDKASSSTFNLTTLVIEKDETITGDRLQSEIQRLAKQIIFRSWDPRPGKRIKMMNKSSFAFKNWEDYYARPRGESNRQTVKTITPRAVAVAKN